MHQCVLWLRMDEIGSGVMSCFSKTKEEAPSQTLLLCLLCDWRFFSFLSVVPTCSKSDLSVVPTVGLVAFPSSPLLLLLPFCWCTCCQHCRGSFIIFFFFFSSFLLLFFFFFFSLRLLKLPRLCASSFSYSCCSSCCCLLTVVPYSLVKKNQRPGQVDSVV